MNLTLAIVLGAAGAVLILIAATGGGFTISALTVPPVGLTARATSLILGGLLVFFALSSDIIADTPSYPDQQAASTGQTTPEPTPAPPPSAAPAPPANSDDPDYSEPVAAPILAPDGYTVTLFSDVETSASPVADLEAGQNVTILCTMQGESVSSDFNGYTSSLWDGVRVANSNTVGFVPDVYVETLTDQPTMPNCQDLWNSNATRA